jgi:type II secretory pathway pseudopilin PulG
VADQLTSLSTNSGLVWYLQQQRQDRRDRKPLNPALPVVSGVLTVGGLLSCTTGTWSGGYPHTFTYQWQRAGVPIGGATNATYTSTLAGSHNCVVTCKTVGGATQAATSNAVTVV